MSAAAAGEVGDTSNGWMADQKLSYTFGEGWPAAASSWQKAYPPGIRLLLNWAAERWHGDLIVTENGWSANSFDAQSAKVDYEQLSYFANYTEQVRHAIVDDGLPVRGYFAWSLMDNFEWADGYSKRFGLFFTDYTTQQRIPKAAARWWAETKAESKRGCPASAHHEA